MTRAEHKKSEPLSEPVVLNQGGGERLSHEIVIGRDGGGGIMNTTHKSTIGISPAISCKETVGNEGPGRNKNASNNNNNNAGCRDNYVPSTAPLRDSSHTNRRSNNVPHAKHITEPRSTGGRPLLAGNVSNASPATVLAKLEFGSRVRRSTRQRSSPPRTPSLVRGASAAREKSVDLFHKAEANFVKIPKKGRKDANVAQ